jgi:S-adenosylmethionine:tRNA ribosyltransferase-isomerase
VYTIGVVELSDFDYVLPAGAIAQTPAEPREASRLLVVDRACATFRDHRFTDLPELLRAGDCVVVNDSRVIPARVMAEDGARRPVELLFLEPVDGGRWRALVRPGRRCRSGAELTVGGEVPARVRIVGIERDGARIVERPGGTVPDLLEVHGAPPLPPYIGRHRKPDVEDRERYQTVFARVPGSVAAPTAGLHFGDAMIERLRARGVEIHALTLHVGPATFRPITTRRVEDHRLAPERVTVPPAVADAVNRARREERRVVAVGTTTTRALEGCAGADGMVEPRHGAVGLCIVPGYRFRVVGALVTNFHLPRSSLLVLVSAFAGRELVLAAYRHAVAAGYRFYSYGDATLLA